VFSNRWVDNDNEKWYATAFYRHTFDTRYASILFRINWPYNRRWESRNKYSSYIHQSCISFIDTCRVSNLFCPSMFFLLAVRYGHLHRVKGVRSKNKRTLCSHASCTGCIDICRVNNLFLYLRIFSACVWLRAVISCKGGTEYK
jgi:hypothetical protein